MSTYDALGGDDALRGVVDDLETRLVTDPVLGPLFEGIDREVMHRHRVSYLAAVLGGPEQYDGQSMRDAHRSLRLTDEHMEQFVHLARQSLATTDIAPEPAQALLDLLERLRPVIVDPTTSGEVSRPVSES